MEKKLVSGILNNNIKYNYLPIKDIKTFSILISFKVGARDEDPSATGYSHLLEHMLFKCTKKHNSPKKIMEKLDRYSSLWNAMTSKHSTVYIAKCPFNNFENIVKLYTDLCFYSLLRKSDIEKEKRVVVEEFFKTVSDSPQYALRKVLSMTLENHPIGNSIIGTKESILGFDRDLVYKYYKQYYNPLNCCITIVGNIGVSLEKFREILEKYPGKVSGKQVFENPVKKDLIPLQQSPKFEIIPYDTQQCIISIGFPVCDMYDYRNVIIIKLLCNIIGGNPSSRLYKEIREKATIAYTVKCETEHYEDCGFLNIRTEIEKSSLFDNKNLKLKKKGGLYLIFNILKKLKKNGITKKEFNNAKIYIKNELILIYENTMSLAQFYNDQLLFQYPKILKITDLISIIDNIKLKDLNNKIKEVFDFSKLNLVIIGKCATKQKIQSFLKKNI